MGGADLPLGEYAAMGFLAFMGAFIRAARWRDDKTGKMIWGKVGLEIPTSIALGAIAIGAGSWAKLDPYVVGGIAGLLGLIGPAAVEAFGATWLKKKVGG